MEVAEQDLAVLAQTAQLLGAARLHTDLAEVLQETYDHRPTEFSRSTPGAAGLVERVARLHGALDLEVTDDVTLLLPVLRWAMTGDVVLTSGAGGRLPAHRRPDQRDAHRLRARSMDLLTGVPTAGGRGHRPAGTEGQEAAVASDDEELFHHRVQAWTVGQLRRSLDGLPDDLPLVANMATEPGGQFVNTQVVISASFGPVVNGDGSEDIDRTPAIGCEYPTGDYHRRRR